MFDWQTEEDEVVWEEEQTAVSKQPTPKKTKWWMFILPLLLLISAGYYIYNQVEQQTASAVADIEADILSSHQLLLEAVEDQDIDLFQLMLSGRDMAWVATQQRLVRSENFLDYAPLNLTYQPDSYDLINIELTPALDSAEVDYSLAYLDEAGNEVRLQQTAVFRPGESRWLYAPPESDFWGSWQTTETDDFTVIYSERDAEWVENFTDDLTDWLPTVCQTLNDLPCDEAWGKSIRFDTDPMARINLTQATHLYENGRQINLPSPSFIGLPTDARSQLWLHNAYKAMLTRVFIADALGYRCCEQITIFDTLATYQLSLLGLDEWPITIDDHYTWWQETASPSIAALSPYWLDETNEPLLPEDAFLLQLLLDFVIHTSDGETAVSLQQQLLQSNQYTLWLRFLLLQEFELFQGSGVSVVNDINDMWRQYTTLYYAAEQTFTDNLPTQDLHLICVKNTTQPIVTSIHQYSIAQQQWHSLTDIPDYNYFFPFADDEQFIQMVLPSGGDVPTSQLYQWTVEGSRPITEGDKYQINLGQISPNGRFVATYLFDTANLDTEDFDTQTNLIDLDQCTESSCAQIETIGAPIWSPDSTKAIFQGMSDFSFVGQLPDNRYWQTGLIDMFDLSFGTLNQDNEFDTVSFGQGYASFWLDDDTLGYLTLNETSGFSELVVMETSNRQKTTLFSAQEFLTLEESGNDNWRIAYAAPIPNAPTQLAIVALSNNGIGHLLHYDLEQDSIEYLLNIGPDQNHLLAISGNGRYIAVATANQPPNLPDRHAVIIDLQTKHTQTYPLTTSNAFPSLTLDWSADSQWLAILSEVRTIQLLHLPTNQRYVIPHPTSNCGSLAWINPPAGD